MQENEVIEPKKRITAAQRIAEKIKAKRIKEVHLPTIDEVVKYKNDSIAKLLTDKSLPLELTALLLKPYQYIDALNDIAGSELEPEELKGKIADVLTAGYDLIKRLAIDPRFGDEEDLEKNILDVHELELEDVMIFFESYTGNLNIGNQEVTREELANFPEGKQVLEPETDRQNG